MTYLLPLLLHLLPLLLLPLSTTSLPDTFLPGPHTVDYLHVPREIFGSLDHQLDIYAPHTPGPMPVLMFFTGLAGTAPAFAYSTLLKHIASWGYVVIGPSGLLHNPADTYKAEWVQGVMDWASEHLPKGDLHPSLLLDMSQLFLAGHSSGNHVSVEFLKRSQDCDNVQALIMFSPVDGVDPFGLVPIFCITPGELLNFRTPTLIVAGGLDTIPGIGDEGGIVPACAPTELGTDRFYTALAGATLLLNMTSYGHADILDDLEADANQALHFCKTDPDSDKAVYRQELGGQAVSFLNYIAGGQCDLWDLLTGDQESGTGVATEVFFKNDVQFGCGKPGCQLDP